MKSSILLLSLLLVVFNYGCSSNHKEPIQQEEAASADEWNEESASREEMMEDQRMEDQGRDDKSLEIPEATEDEEVQE